MAFRELTNSGGAMLKWEHVGVNTSIEGTVQAFKSGKVFNGRPSKLAVLVGPDGKTEMTIPLPTKLENAFIEYGIVPGVYVRITHLGMVQGKTARYRDFRLEYDDERGERPRALSPTPAPAPAQQSELAALTAALVARKGQAAADSILNAAKAIAKTEEEQVKVLRQAMGVGG